MNTKLKKLFIAISLLAAPSLILAINYYEGSEQRSNLQALSLEKLAHYQGSGCGDCLLQAEGMCTSPIQESSCEGLFTNCSMGKASQTPSRDIVNGPSPGDIPTVGIHNIETDDGWCVKYTEYKCKLVSEKYVEMGQIKSRTICAKIQAEGPEYTSAWI